MIVADTKVIFANQNGNLVAKKKYYFCKQAAHFSAELKTLSLEKLNGLSPGRISSEVRFTMHDFLFWFMCHDSWIQQGKCLHRWISLISATGTPFIRFTTARCFFFFFSCYSYVFCESLRPPYSHDVELRVLHACNCALKIERNPRVYASHSILARICISSYVGHNSATSTTAGKKKYVHPTIVYDLSILYLVILNATMHMQHSWHIDAEPSYATHPTTSWNIIA